MVCTKEGPRLTRAAFIACATVVFALQLGSCAKPASDSERAAWGQSFLKARSLISMSILRFETLRDSFDTADAWLDRFDPKILEICDPANDAKGFESTKKVLDDLASEAPKHGLGDEVVESLHRIQQQFLLMRERQMSRWSQSADVAGLEFRERCLRAKDVASIRIAAEREVYSILKIIVTPRDTKQRHEHDDAEWGSTLIDTHSTMSQYMLRLETLRDKIETERAPIEECDLAKNADQYEKVSQQLEDLVTGAVWHGHPAVNGLHHIREEWQLLRRNEVNHWSWVPPSGLDPIDRCVRRPDVAGTRLEIERHLDRILTSLITETAPPNAQK
jgi:hypothetical protein